MKLRKIIAYIKSYRYFLKFTKFGKLSYIDRPMLIDINHGNVEIGDMFRIQPGLRMELLNKNSNIRIGKNVSIGQNFHVTSGGDLNIGNNVTISGNVFITNIDHDYKDVGIHILKQRHIIRDTYIGDNCFIGYGAAIQAGTKLGKQCIVGTNAVVRGEFPDYSVIVGVPGRVIKIYNQNSNQWEPV